MPEERGDCEFEGVEAGSGDFFDDEKDDGGRDERDDEHDTGVVADDCADCAAHKIGGGHLFAGRAHGWAQY